MAVAFLDVDVDAVHQAILTHEREIGLIDVKIQGLMQSVRRLQFQKDLHNAEIRKCKGKITLASRLPPEILAYIFELCVLDGRTRTPLIVSHVCSSWRIAATTPTVWSHVYINLDSRYPCQRTQLWLRNSRQTLLTIEIEINADTSQLKSTVEVLLAEIWRWKTLILKSSSLDPVNQVLRLCDSPASHLRSIEISVSQEFLSAMDGLDDNPHDLMGLHALSAKAPLFQTLRIHRSLVPGRHSLPPSITDLTLQLTDHDAPTILHSMSSVLRLLGELPNLEVLALEMPSRENQSFLLDAQNGHQSLNFDGGP
uniref:F-box domain-containing protein n=1 Tax=Psilocybe cubensis TaxID=181762 RepID=A0A8H7Y1L8_PSICU